MAGFIPPPFLVDNVTLQQDVNGIASLKSAPSTIRWGPSSQGASSIATGTRYPTTNPAAASGWTATESDSDTWIAPAAGTVDQLRVDSAQAATGTIAATLRRAPAATPGTPAATDVTIAPAAGLGAAVYQVLADPTHSFTVAAGDVVTLEVVIATTACQMRGATARFRSA